jgi:hypothetical protein
MNIWSKKLLTMRPWIWESDNPGIITLDLAAGQYRVILQGAGGSGGNSGSGPNSCNGGAGGGASFIINTASFISADGGAGGGGSGSNSNDGIAGTFNSYGCGGGGIAGMYAYGVFNLTMAAIITVCVGAPNISPGGGAAQSSNFGGSAGGAGQKMVGINSGNPIFEFNYVAGSGGGQVSGNPVQYPGFGGGGMATGGAGVIGQIGGEHGGRGGWTNSSSVASAGKSSGGGGWRAFAGTCAGSYGQQAIGQHGDDANAIGQDSYYGAGGDSSGASGGIGAGGAGSSIYGQNGGSGGNGFVKIIKIL